MKNILFVCTGNSCRSVMADVLFKRMAADKNEKYSVGSAGVFAMDGYPPTQETIRVMNEEGVDVSGHRSRRLTFDLVRAADKIYVMEFVHKAAVLSSWPETLEKVFLMTEFSSNPKKKKEEINIPDPIHRADLFYKEVLGTIRDCVQNIVKNLEAG